MVGTFYKQRADSFVFKKKSRNVSLILHMISSIEQPRVAKLGTSCRLCITCEKKVHLAKLKPCEKCISGMIFRKNNFFDSL